MQPKPRRPEQDDLLRPRLVDLIDMRHELVKLETLIDWEFFEREWAGFFPSGRGRPAASPRLVAGLLYLQRAFKLPNEAVVARWVENPYYQNFCGETFFQHRPPVDPSSLTRWRKRIGDEGVEWLLMKSIDAGRASGTVSGRSLERVSVDTTVMERNIAYPTDAPLYETARRKLVALAGEAGVELRQSYARLAPRLAVKAGRYAHARQFKRMRKALRTLKGYTGRVMRDLRRRLDDFPKGPLRERVRDMLVLASRLLHQKPKDKGKFYSLHEPGVDCISKVLSAVGPARQTPGGAFESPNARVRYEFGTKVSVAAIICEGFIVGARALPGNPYDGHTLAEPLEQVEVLTGCRPALAVVDRCYRGNGVETTRVLISGTRRGMTPSLAKLLRRRSAIEPEIGHMKTDGRLTRCPLNGTAGDALFACGHNLRKILAHLRAFLALLIAALLGAIRAERPHARGAVVT